MHPELSDVIAIKDESSKRAAGRPGDVSNNSDVDSASNSLLKAKVTFNIGGVLFQTLESTIKNVTVLKEESFQAHFDVVNNEYFFDRDPEVFRSILNYWRTGKLHLPLYRCGPSVRDELVFWGLEELDIEPCCWNNYNTGIATRASLDKLRRDSVKEKESKYIEEPTTRLGHFRLHMWYLLTTPSYSKTAKIYEICAVFFAVLAIFSLCASTTDVFQIAAEDTGNISVKINETVTVKEEQETCRGRLLGPKKQGNYDVHPVLKVVDYMCLVVFTLEYVARLLCASKPWRFISSMSAIIDMLAILPDYIEFILEGVYHNPGIATDVSILILLRLMRVIRVLRVIRRVPGLCVMIFTLKASYKELFLMLLFMMVGTLLFGSVIHFVDDNRTFTSIPASFWWAIVTMTTVGYGDLVPTTPLGQMVGSITAVCGVLLIAFSIPSLVNNFMCYSVLVQYDAHQTILRERKQHAIPLKGSRMEDHRQMIKHSLKD